MILTRKSGHLLTMVLLYEPCHHNLTDHVKLYSKCLYNITHYKCWSGCVGLESELVINTKALSSLPNELWVTLGFPNVPFIRG